MNVLVLSKRLEAEPEVPEASGVTVAPLCVPEEVSAWLALRERSFADERPPVRPWSVQDFLREMGDNEKGERRAMWLARSIGAVTPPACGAASLSTPARRPVAANLHWLMVDPDWRGRGVGTLLLKTVERYCWEHGWRELRLETHGGWTAAVRFYERHGFR